MSRARIGHDRRIFRQLYSWIGTHFLPYFRALKILFRAHGHHRLDRRGAGHVGQELDEIQRKAMRYSYGCNTTRLCQIVPDASDSESGILDIDHASDSVEVQRRCVQQAGFESEIGCCRCADSIDRSRVNPSFFHHVDMNTLHRKSLSDLNRPF